MKEQVKVLINSKKEYKQYKAILKGLGESFRSESYSKDMTMIMFDGVSWSSYGDPQGKNSTEIRDLIILLTKPEEEKVFVMTSEDGVKLYVGDEMYGAHYQGGLKTWIYKDFNGEAFILEHSCIIIEEDEDFPYISSPQNHKAFSTKEAAEKWILEQNKPKSIRINLFNSGSSAEVSKDVIILNIDGYRLGIKPSDLEEMTNAMNKINNQ